MKKGVSLIFLVFIFSLVLTSFISALALDLKQTSLNAGQTLQVELSGNFLTTLTKDNFGIYFEDGVHKSPVESGLVRIEGNYFFYAIVPNTPGKYQLKVEDATYTEYGMQKTDPIIKNFSVVASNSSYISFNPGYIYATRDIILTIKAYNSDQNIDIELPTNNYKITVKVFEEQSKTVTIPITGISGTVKTELKVGSHSIPTTIIGNSTEIPEVVETTRDLDDLLDLRPKELDLVTLANYENFFELELVNIYRESVDLTLSSSHKEIVLNETELENFRDWAVIGFTINSKKDIEGFINISSKNQTLQIPITIKITSNKTKVNSSVIPVNNDKTCKSLGGVSSCAENQICDRETTASDGYCCLSGCKTQSSSGGWIWGVILILILAVGGWYFYDKYKHNPKQDKALERRTEMYKKRMSPGIEVSRGLGRE